MAVNSYDATDGHPIFVDSDEPDVKLDPTKAAEYAAKAGTRAIGTTAQRTSPPSGWPVAREGLRWRDTTNGVEYEHDGSGWNAVGGVCGIAVASAAQTIVDSTDTVLTFSSASVEKGVIFGSNGFTAVVTEWHEVSLYALFDPDSDGQRRMRVLVDGVSNPRYARTLAVGANHAPVNLTIPVYLTAGELVTVQAYHTAGDDLDVTYRSLTVKLLAGG